MVFSLWSALDVSWGHILFFVADLTKKQRVVPLDEYYSSIISLVWSTRGGNGCYFMTLLLSRIPVLFFNHRKRFCDVTTLSGYWQSSSCEVIDNEHGYENLKNQSGVYSLGAGLDVYSHSRNYFSHFSISKTTKSGYFYWK